MLTVERLYEVVDYDTTTGIFRRKIRRGGRNIGDIAGTKHWDGYLVFSVDGQTYYAHRLAWFYATGEIPPEVDHINGKRDDNRLCNLRPVTFSQNSQNSKLNGANSSGHKGVHWHKGTKKWRAVIWVKRKPKHLGLFTDVKEAAAAYAKAAKKYFGEFARLR